MLQFLDNRFSKGWLFWKERFKQAFDFFSRISASFENLVLIWDQCRRCQLALSGVAFCTVLPMRVLSVLLVVTVSDWDGRSDGKAFGAS